MTSTVTRSVPFFDYPHIFASQEAELVDIFRDVGRRGAFILQKDLAAFEQDLAGFTGSKYALGVGNATDGLTIALLAAGIGAGDEVILCSHTMIATASAVYFAGAHPVPVEAGADHLIDPAAVERAITPRTRALMPTQLNGRTCDMHLLQSIADKHNLPIIEDAAQALGSKFKGRCAGTFGIASAISFYPAKVLGCLGDGGAVLTSDDAVYDRLLQLRDHGRAPDGEVVSWGMNTRLDNLQAAILHMQLKKYGEVVARRRAMARIYQDRLLDIAEVVLPPAPDSDSNHFDIFQNYEIEAERRDDLKRFLKDNGIGTLVQWGGQPVHQCSKLGFTQHLPYTDRLFERMLMLPLNMSLQDEDVEYICEVVRMFYR
ncbi:MAG: DegT/DnrJ/EryC1/StrS family aminotransferase [Acidobacteriota bacterium]|nr:DegT/DnrJ/EryC1/StrS family aminotransferase [Acidobacteriota bacterium]